MNAHSVTLSRRGVTLAPTLFIVPTTTQVVQTLIDEIGRVAAPRGIEALTVYLPIPWNDDAPSLLVHAGAGAPVPELATEEAARAFSAAVPPMPDAHTPPEMTKWAIRESHASDGLLMPIPLMTAWWGSGRPPAESRQPAELRRQTDVQPTPAACGWLGLRLAPDVGPAGQTANWLLVLELARAFASTLVRLHGTLLDPLTALPGRPELLGTLRGDLHRARTHGLPYAVLFINPCDLDDVNERRGRRAGDAVLREFVDALQVELRQNDVVMRYGAGIFALLLPDTARTAALLVAEKVCRRLSDRTFLNDSVRLSCAVGAVWCDAAEVADLEPSTLLRRANEAVAAARADGGSRVALWSPEGQPWAATAVDPLIEIFTGETEKDYRNMGLLWNVLQVVSKDSGCEGVARAVVHRLLTQLKMDRVALVRADGRGGLDLLSGICRDHPGGGTRAIAADELGGDALELVTEALTTRQPVTGWVQRTGDGSNAPLRTFAVALITGQRILGALYLAGDPELVKLDRTDLPILAGVAGQLALALDREQLAEVQRERGAAERRRLQTELRELRAALPGAPMVCTSSAVMDLLNVARRVAPTDATVLITGESGTGKELLAHTVHQLSLRRGKPLVIVDCGAIPATLIESELFGRERGAYTGAERTVGRLAQASGGTVLLDEIGELPLDVQSKLLRFVQEKTLTTVGGTRVQRVDVRIIAATNRPLEDEVRAGRFRGDLFYRLNVVRLEMPPLRERPEDVLPLARQFIQNFAAHHGKQIDGLSAEAAALLMSHDWPGNVRELQNVILRAVVLADGTTVSAADLSLGRPPAAAEPLVELPEHESLGVTIVGPSATSRSPAETPAGAWACLAERLAGQVEDAMAARPWVARPLGRWLRHDLVLEAHDREQQVAARAAIRLGVPETTFARWLHQAQADRATSHRPESWRAVQLAIASVIASANQSSQQDVAARADAMLLEIVLAAIGERAVPAAALMGCSVPTFKRRRAMVQTPPGHIASESQVRGQSVLTDTM